MTVTYQDVLDAAGAGGVDQDLATRVLGEAQTHLTMFVNVNLLDPANPLPDDVNDSALLRCATDLFARAKAPFGTQILPDGSGQVVVSRIGADPLAGVYSLIRPWAARVGLG